MLIQRVDSSGEASPCDLSNDPFSKRKCVPRRCMPGNCRLQAHLAGTNHSKFVQHRGMHGMHLWAIQVKRTFVQLRLMGLLWLLWLMTLWLMWY